MSQRNGEKARASIAKKRRTAQREKDRAALAAIKSGVTSNTKPAESK